ncbi:MAG: class I SAM-dependent methyltransferase [Bacilli bacterium]|nr:class I SAM-dependent methyltransferase [Bacilli bacterium]
MSHYFDFDDSIASKRRTIKFQIYDQEITLVTDNGVFSKNRVDEGSLAFLQAIIPLHLTGKILDLGCGYGPLGLTIALTSPTAELTLADINQRAVELASFNAQNLNLSKRVTCLQSDIYSKIEGQFDSIICNPPVRAGKRVTYAIYEGAHKLLIDGGSLYIVLRKAQGAESASKYIETVFGNVSVLLKKKGYWVIQAKK